MNALPIAGDDRFTFAQGALSSTMTGNLGADNGAGVDADPDGAILGWVAGTGFNPVGDGDRYLGAFFSGGQLGFLTIQGTVSYPFPVWETMTAVATAQGGTAWISTNGSFTYQSAAGFTGVDSFVYTLVDGAFGTDTASVTLNVTPTAGANDRPVAMDDAFVLIEDSVLAGSVLADNGNGADRDPDGDALSVRAQTIRSDAGGVVQINADGSFSYTPLAGFSGVDGFRYTLLDPGAAADTGAVNLTVTPVNDAPVARDDAFSGVHGRPITGSVLGNDTDQDGDALTVIAAVLTTATGGEVTLNADGSFIYRPSAGHVGSDGFAYTVVDPTGAADEGRVALTLTNATPVARGDLFATAFGQGLAGNLLVNNGNGADSDADGDALTVVGGTFTSAQGGVLAVAANGSFAYTPAALFFGTDSFAYTVRDDFGGQSTATARFVTPAPAGAWHGTEGDDVWTGNDSGGWAFAGGGDDAVFAMGGKDSVAGGDGRDTINGGTGADTLYGEADKDVLNGDGGNDRLFGGAGADALSGGAGADTLRGGADADRLKGGGGADHFVFEAPAPGALADRIVDFGLGDRLVFAAADLGLAAGALPDASYLALTGSGDAGHARFVYNAAARGLYWDADGLGGTTDQLICTFDNRVSLLIDHFVLT